MKHFSVENHGSLMLVRPLTRAAMRWVKQNVVIPSYMWMGDAFACEPRYVEDIIEGATYDIGE